jgi:hypothetical protein
MLAIASNNRLDVTQERVGRFGRAHRRAGSAALAWRRRRAGCATFTHTHTHTHTHRLSAAARCIVCGVRCGRRRPRASTSTPWSAAYMQRTPRATSTPPPGCSRCRACGVAVRACCAGTRARTPRRHAWAATRACGGSAALPRGLAREHCRPSRHIAPPPPPPNRCIGSRRVRAFAWTAAWWRCVGFFVQVRGGGGAARWCRVTAAASRAAEPHHAPARPHARAHDTPACCHTHTHARARRCLCTTTPWWRSSSQRHPAGRRPCSAWAPHSTSERGRCCGTACAQHDAAGLGC